MDPVQYLLHLIEQGKSVADAYSHTRQRFGIGDRQIDGLVIDAFGQAQDLVRAIRRHGLLERI